MIIVLLVAMMAIFAVVAVMMWMQKKAAEEALAKRDNAGVNLIMGILGSVI